MRRFFCADILEDKDKVCIKGEESKHIVRVLRMSAGDKLVLFDGSGYDYECRILSANKDSLSLSVGEKKKNSREPNIEISLYQAMLKNDNMDWVLKKTTELGISDFIPLISARCVKRPENTQKIFQKYQKIVLEAAKQCGRSLIPTIHKPVDLEDLPEIMKKHEIVILAYENENKTLKQQMQRKPFCDIGIVIGPEGGFEPEEASMLVNAGAVSCSLGNLILRAETAAIAAVSMILYEKMEIE